MSSPTGISLRLLGPFAASIDGEPPLQLEIRSKKGCALLAFLAVHPQHRASRQQLVALLWGDRSAHHARQNLRQCLASLRADLAGRAPDLLVVGADQISLPTNYLTIDVLELAELARSSQLPDLELAVKLWRGPFLADFSLGLPSFDNWLRVERARIEMIAAGLFANCADRYDILGSGQQAIQVAKCLVEIDPLREDWQRRLLRLYARYQGCDAAAPHARAMAEFLRSELGADLAPETKALVADVQQGRIAPAPVTILSALPNDAGTDCDHSVVSDRGPRGDLWSAGIRHKKPSITVLPFVNMSADEELDYFSCGIVEDITTALARAKSFAVLAPHSFCSDMQVPRDLGCEPRVGYVLSGAIRRMDDRVRITVRLVETWTGSHIWARAYTHQGCDVFAAQDDVSSNIIASIEPCIYAAEAARAKCKPLHALDSHGCLAMALSVTKVRSRQNYAFAEDLVRRAIALDPVCARAHSILAYFAGLQLLWGWKSREHILALAFDAAQKSVMLDEDDPWAHLALGWVFTQSRATEAGIEEYEKAIALNPDCPHPYSCLGLALGYLGRTESALAELDKAERLGVQEIFVGLNDSARAGVFFCAERHDEAIVAARRSVLQSPCLVTSQRQLVVNYALSGELEKARVEFSTFMRLVPNCSLESIGAALPHIRDSHLSRTIDAFQLMGLK